MKNNTVIHRCFFVFLLAMLLGLGSIRAQKLYEERIYEPVVLRGGVLSAFYDVPVNEIFVYAYDADTQIWTMIPFQIDERIRARDPFKPGNEDAWWCSYFIPDDDSLDYDDELAFMIGDLGDKAPDNVWIDNEEARNYKRLELMISDPNDSNNRAYGYLFRSSTITDEVPAPYDFTFDPENQIAGSKYYSVRLSKNNGLIEDVVIKPPFGTGVDIFDTQKLRFIGVFDFGFFTFTVGKGGRPAANEQDNLHVYNEDDTDNYHLGYTQNPIVRLIREVRHTIKFGTYSVDELAFYVQTKFYPYSGTLKGGASLDPEELKEEFQTEEDIYIGFDLLRQSWDFNEAAVGMRFFNRYNQNVLIDGNPDQVNTSIDIPIKEWALVTGDQGSMFTHVEFKDTTWQSIGLYFYDNEAGGQGDGTIIEGGDTGDGVSYGDHGILFESLAQDSVSVELGFTAYILQGNLEKADGERLAYWAEYPVVCSSNAVSYPTGVIDENEANVPAHFELLQNYPNPFNNSTRISFRLSSTQHVTLKIFDTSGRTVATLADGLFPTGVHEVHWNGLDNQSQEASSGLYFCVLRSKIQSSIKKLLLIR